MLTASRKSRTPINGAKTMLMRKMIALATALTFVFVVPTFAATAEPPKATPHVSGTIASWDDATKLGTVKGSTGTETSFGWNEKTTITGIPKIGEHVSVSYSKDKDGKIWATHVSVGAKPASTKPPAPK
jgi:hypothetical protein